MFSHATQSKWLDVVEAGFRLIYVGWIFTEAAKNVLAPYVHFHV